jgi:hypothetical protein
MPSAEVKDNNSIGPLEHQLWYYTTTLSVSLIRVSTVLWRPTIVPSLRRQRDLQIRGGRRNGKAARFTHATTAKRSAAGHHEERAPQDAARIGHGRYGAFGAIAIGGECGRTGQLPEGILKHSVYAPSLWEKFERRRRARQRTTPWDWHIVCLQDPIRYTEHMFSRA